MSRNGNSVNRIKGDNGVIIESDKFLELAKAPTKKTPEVKRGGMIRYNKEWKAFEGALDFEDETVEYRRFAQLDDNGRLLTSQLPDYVTSGLRYIGTFNPILDDTDPPMGSQVDKLLPSDTENRGHYYIIRGLFDTAVKHFVSQRPTTSPATFIATNENGEGDWIEIKYYFGNDPANAETQKIVLSAFGRIIKSTIPAEHEGLISLSTDDELTKEFTSDNDQSKEIALTDGDWIISTGDKWQRLRQSRVSILAGEVMYDRALMYNTNRVLTEAQTGTVQDMLDAFVLSALRRTGDSMMDNGSPAAGRLAFVYGTETKPSLTFNNDPYDTKNSGINPEYWSDHTTGIFHPAMNSVGITAAGTEKFRVEPNYSIFYQNDIVNADTLPALQFNHKSNTKNVGISGIADTISFSVNDKSRVEFKKDVSNFYEDVYIVKTLTVDGNIHGKSSINIEQNGTIGVDFTVKGNTVLGSGETNKLNVNAKSRFEQDAVLVKSVTIGTECSSGSTFVVNSPSSFKCDTNFDSNITVGTACDSGKTFSVNIPSNLHCKTTIDGELVANGESTFNNKVLITATDKCSSANKLTIEIPSLFDCQVDVNGVTNLHNDVTIGDTKNTKTLTINNKTNIVGDTTMSGNLTATGINKLQGTTIIGTTCNSSNRLTVNGESTFGCKSTFNGDSSFNTNVIIGEEKNNNSTFTVNIPSTFNNTITATDNVTFEKNVIAKGEISIGTDCTNGKLNVLSPSEFNCNSIFNNKVYMKDAVNITGASLTVESTKTTISNEIVLGTGCGTTDTVTINAPLTSNCTGTFNGDTLLKGGTTISGDLNITSGSLSLGNNCDSKININGTTTVNCGITFDSDGVVFNSTPTFKSGATFDSASKISFMYNGDEISQIKPGSKSLTFTVNSDTSTIDFKAKVNGLSSLMAQMNYNGFRMPRENNQALPPVIEGAFLYHGATEQMLVGNKTEWKPLGGVQVFNKVVVISDWVNQVLTYEIPAATNIQSVSMFESATVNGIVEETMVIPETVKVVYGDKKATITIKVATGLEFSGSVKVLFS